MHDPTLLPVIVVAYFAPTHACLTLYSAPTTTTTTPPHTHTHAPQQIPHTLPLRSRAADAVTTATGGRLASEAPFYPVPQEPTTGTAGPHNIAANPELRHGPRPPRGRWVPSMTAAVASVGSRSTAQGRTPRPSASHNTGPVRIPDAIALIGRRPLKSMTAVTIWLIAMWCLFPEHPDPAQC